MRSCDTLILGAGYTSLGYATVRPDTLIVEERELCDVSFCLPQRGYGSVPIPEGGLGRELYEFYRERGLVRGGELNVGALEMGLCAFMLDRGVRALLKCRAVSVVEESGLYTVTVVGGGGLERIRAARVLDMRPTAGRELLTLLFTADGRAEADTVASVFPDGRVSAAFYEGRYALTLEVSGDYAQIKRSVCERWREGEHKGKLLYIAPTLARVTDPSGGLPLDSDYSSPFDAVAAGAKYAEEV